MLNVTHWFLHGVGLRACNLLPMEQTWKVPPYDDILGHKA